ncbi:MAG: hypothetical protein Q9173_002417 [Seirophora scorigena]
MSLFEHRGRSKGVGGDLIAFKDPVLRAALLEHSNPGLWVLETNFEVLLQGCGAQSEACKKGLWQGDWRRSESFFLWPASPYRSHWASPYLGRVSPSLGPWYDEGLALFFRVPVESLSSALLKLKLPKRDDVREPKDGVGIRDFRCRLVDDSDAVSAADIRRRLKGLPVSLFSFFDSDDLRRILSDKDGLDGGNSMMWSIRSGKPPIAVTRQKLRLYAA